MQLLRTKTVGRVGLSASSLPFVLPVRYVVDDDRILMRTGESTRMAAATSDAVVAFEVDEFDAERAVADRGQLADISGERGRIGRPGSRPGNPRATGPGGPRPRAPGPRRRRLHYSALRRQPPECGRCGNAGKSPGHCQPGRFHDGQLDALQ